LPKGVFLNEDIYANQTGEKPEDEAYAGMMAKRANAKTIEVNPSHVA
jgi:hypothetical protein